MRILVLLLVVLFVKTKCDDYYANRARILKLEAQLSVGGNVTLTDKENIVNNCLMRHKFNDGIEHPDLYDFSHHFFTYKDKIVKTKVYQIIKEMPKGAVLHIHDTAILGADYMLNITYMDHLYVCFGTKTLFRFSENIPDIPCDKRWQIMSDVRLGMKNVTKFDMEIKKHFTAVVKHPDMVYPNSEDIWNTFGRYFRSVSSLLLYRPMWKQYIYDVLKALREDNVSYVEIKTSLLNCYELNGTIHDDIVTAKIYEEVIQEFIKDHPDFFGVKLIIASSRKITNLNTRIQHIKTIKEKIPGLIVGLDLVGHEDVGRPLLDFMPTLNLVKDMDFFFHAGETNLFGTSVDENLVDAVLLGSKRIGHAYALTKHPLIMKEVIERDIAIEVNVISNVVLSLVRNIRNHPLSMFLSHGLPVVLSSDDPGVWETAPLSDDFYMAFVGVASKQSDLRMLKTLALNSLKYSALDSFNKRKVILGFQMKWNNFVNNFKCPL